MAKYLYKPADELADCDEVELDFPIGQAPDQVEFGGFSYRRVITPPAIQFKGSGWASKS